MGRKSNTKKIVRQLIKEKGKKQSFFDKFFGEKNKKDIKKEVLKSKNEESLNRAHGASAQRGEQSGSASCETKRAYNKEKKKTVKKSNKKFAFIKARKHKIFGGMLALIMLLILGYVGFLIFQRAFRPEPIAKFLPQDKVMAFIEINSNFDHQQVKKTFDLLSKYPELSKEKLIEKAEGKFLFSYERELKPWLGRNIGMAFFSDNSMVYFGEVFSGKNAKKFLASKNSYLKTNYKDRDFYMSPTGGNFVFIGDYLFFSEKKSTLEYLVDFNNDRKNSIYSSREYGKMASNLPLNKAGFLYLNFNELRKSNLIQNEFLKTFMKLLNSEGLAVIAMDDKFAIQSFLNLSKSEVTDSKYISLREKYKADLMAYISKDVVAFWGGENLGNQLQRFIESLSGGKIIANEGANKILEIYSKKYFGSDVDFKKDIIPVFEDEFAFGIENTNSGYAYDLIINIDAKKSEIIHRLADGFAKTGGVFEEKTIEHTLSDGTVGEEIVSVPAETVRDKTTYENMDIYGIKFGENKGVFYTLFDNKVAVSNNIDSLKKIIDISIKKSNSLKLSPIFEKLINPILKNSDEVSYFNLEKLLPMVFKDKKDIPFFLIPFSKISSGNNYFDDGIATVNYVEIN